MRRFWELLREAAEALEEPEERRTKRLEDLKAEVQAQLAFPGGEDPVGRALRLGREALAHLVERDPSGACRKLWEALGLHPGLGRGQAYRLLKALAQGGGGPEDCQVAEGELRKLEALLAEAQEDRALALSRLLRDLPPWFWEPLFGARDVPRGRPRPRRREGPPPRRPRLTVAIRHVKPPRPPEEDRPLAFKMMSIWERGSAAPSQGGGYWSDRSGRVRVQGARLWVDLVDLPGHFLLLLKKPTGYLLLPGRTEGRGWVARVPEGFLEEVDLEMEVWAGEDLTPTLLRKLLEGAQGVSGQGLREWLEEGIRLGVLRDKKRWRQLWRALALWKPPG